MSADPANLAAKGAAALSAQDYPAAIDAYTQAIAGIPSSIDYYIKRSTAYQRAGDYDNAFNDAEIAVVLAQKKGKRELLGQSQMRRGISAMLMGRYGDAGVCFKWAEKYNAADKSIPVWQKKLEIELGKIEEEDLRREVMIKEIPDVDVPKPAKRTDPAPAAKSGGAGDSGRVEELPDDYEEPVSKEKGKAVEGEKKEVAAPPPAPPTGVTTAVDKIRHEWYQTNTTVSISLFVKGVPKDETTVEFEDQSLTITFPLANGSEFTFSLDPLAHPINPSSSTYKVLGTKVEFSLTKAEQGKKWAALESKEPIAEKKSTKPAADKPPSYPTSSRSGPKNWDKVVHDLAATSKAKKDTTKKGDKKDDDEDKEDVDYADLEDDDFSSDPVNGFFKKLYKDADPDTRRAMMKSYQESNGTALSTNWAEVGKGKVETSPPDGMEARKW